jgi:hypothetical protein
MGEPVTMKISRDQIVWQGEKFVIYRDPEKGLMRYLPQFKAAWPVTVFVAKFSEDEIWENL